MTEKTLKTYLVSSQPVVDACKRWRWYLLVVLKVKGSGGGEVKGGAPRRAHIPNSEEKRAAME